MQGLERGHARIRDLENTSNLSMEVVSSLHGHLAHQKPPPPRTLRWEHDQGPMGVLEGAAVSYERGTLVVRGHVRIRDLQNTRNLSMEGVVTTNAAGVHAQSARDIEREKHQVQPI